jgi:hypothetical protein
LAAVLAELQRGLVTEAYRAFVAQLVEERAGD